MKKTNSTKTTVIENTTEHEVTLMEHIEKIAILSKESKLSTKFFQKVNTHIRAVTDILKITEMQSILLSVFANNYYEHLSVKDIAEHFECLPIQLLKHKKEIDELKNRNFICRQKYKTEYSYRITQECLDNITQGTEHPYSYNKKSASIEEFWNKFDELFDKRYESGYRQSTISYSDFVEEVTDLIEDNAHFEFCTKIKKIKQEISANDHDIILLLCFCNQLIFEDDDNITINDFKNIFDRVTLKKLDVDLKEQKHKFFKHNLIENVNDNGFSDRNEYKLSDKAKQELLSEINLTQKKTEKGKDILQHSSFAEKKMFYNLSEQKQITQLTELLKEENFNSVKQRLANKGMRTGFACLFHGAPGTGKTETAYQIAKKTGRNIMFVDISQTKSSWFGESEKEIKRIFTRYRDLVKSAKVTPILLFNEADAVIGKRKDVTIGNVAQTENAIQNIILQEMETLEGIMIATTNLTENLDKAFERRFLYKIEFSKPNVEAKANIWKSIINTLSDKEAEILSQRFDFSGGQIENISRKCTVDSIISGDDPSFETLITHCENERLEKERTLIGFLR